MEIHLSEQRSDWRNKKRGGSHATKRAYFIGTEKPGKPQRYYIRSKIVSKYHLALETYREKLRLFKKIFIVMEICKDNGGYITKGEFVAILRE